MTKRQSKTTSLLRVLIFDSSNPPITNTTPQMVYTLMVSFIHQAANAVLGTEKRDELNAVGGVEEIDGGISLAIGAGVIRD